MLSALFRKFICCVVFLGLLLPVALVAQESPPPETGAPTASLLLDSDRAEPGLLAVVVSQLSSESRAKFGQMLAADWLERPEWGEMLIALLRGDEMRPPFGWYRPSELKFGYDWLSAKFDANADGIVDETELPEDTPDLDRIFARLDRDANGKLQPLDFNYAGGKGQGSIAQSASQFLFSRLDGDTDGRVTAEELNQFFSQADREKSNFLTAEDLFLDFTEEVAARESLRGGRPEPDEMLGMFFRGELGLWKSGPNLGDEAPDFTLPTYDGGRTVTLSQCRGKPVILIFGSFT